MASEAKIHFEPDEEDDNYVDVTFTNTTDEILYDYEIVAALYDQNGELLFINTEVVSGIGSASGQHHHRSAVHLRGYSHVLLPRRPHAHDRGCAGLLRKVKRKSCKTHRPRGGAFFHALSRKSAAIPRKNRFITES